MPVYSGLQSEITHWSRYSQGRPVYVHCVMHKCIMVKLGGNEKHKKYVKKT